MANLAQSLNSEIRRLARREANALVAPLRTTITQLRREIWRLNRDNRALDKKIQQGPRTATGLPVVDGTTAATGKIGPRLIAKLRKRLNLSQGEFGTLLDVSPNSISNWETGSARPNADMRAKLIAARQMGRRDVKKMLKEKAAVSTTAAKNPAPKVVKKAVVKAAAPKMPAKKVVETITTEPALAVPATVPEEKKPAVTRTRK